MSTAVPLMARVFVRTAFLLVFLTSAAACKEDTGVKVKSFAFKGNKAVSAGQLKTVLATGASSKIPWGTKRYFSREQFEADLKRIVAFYTDRGYPDARVSSFDVKLNEKQDAVDITINISEGEPVTVERIVMEGFEQLPDEHRTTLDTKLPLKVGAPIDRALLQASREAALDELRDHGHPYASVRLSESPGSSDRQQVITFRAEPGPIAHVGDIQISGNATVSEKVVRRQLTFRPGSLFRQSRLQESQRRLYGLELFQFANIEPVGLETKSETVPVRVTVTKSDHKKVNFGFGYGTEEKARAEIDWRHVNAFGGAQTVGIAGRYSSLDRGVRVTYKEPYIFSPRWSLGVNGQMWQTREPAYDLDTTGGRVTLTRQFARGGGPVLGGRPRTTLAFSYANEYDRCSVSPAILADLSQRDEVILIGCDPTRSGEHSGQRSAISVEGSRNTTDNLLDAKRGYLASLHLEQAGKFLGGTYDYWEITSEGRTYFKIANAAVLAVQARAGYIRPSGDPETDVPFFKRYFLGGASNLRGWGRLDVSPLSLGGLPIGGTRFVNTSVELRAPIWSNLSGVVFLDAGRVSTSRVGDLQTNTGWRYDVGPGLRYQTPIGPIRADLGYQLTPIEGLLVNGKKETRHFRFHFSIGQAF
jgi:outer membrane protein assembly complex protein YaeT